MFKLWLVSGAIFGLLSVALGAFGAHALKNTLDDYGRSTYEKAVHYQMFHTIALLAVGILQNHFKDINFNLAGFGFLIGVILFSGSLYILSLTGIRMIGIIAPIGGISFIIGWGWLTYSLSKI